MWRILVLFASFEFLFSMTKSTCPPDFTTTIEHEYDRPYKYRYSHGYATEDSNWPYGQSHSRPQDRRQMNGFQDLQDFRFSVNRQDQRQRNRGGCQGRDRPRPRPPSDDQVKLNEYLDWIRKHTTVYNYRFASDNYPYSPLHEGGPPPMEGWQPPKIDPSLLQKFPVSPSNISPDQDTLGTKSPVDVTPTWETDKITESPIQTQTESPPLTSTEEKNESREEVTMKPQIVETTSAPFDDPQITLPSPLPSEAANQTTPFEVTEPSTLTPPQVGNDTSNEEPLFVYPLEPSVLNETSCANATNQDHGDLDNDKDSDGHSNVEQSSTNVFEEVSNETNEQVAGHGVCSCIIRRPHAHAKVDKQIDDSDQIIY